MSRLVSASVPITPVWASGLALALMLAAGCAADRELPPADLVCGDGVVALPFEGCDSESPGCVDCQVADGWRCGDDTCETVCGDGVWARPPADISPVDPNFILYEECDESAADSTGPCNSSCQGNFKPEPCDMNGYWIVRQADFSRALSVLVQTSSTWFVHHISQIGSGGAGDPGRFTIDESIMCGVEVSGSATVNLPSAGRAALLYRNAQSGALYLDGGGLPLPGEIERPPRTGVIERTDDGCSFEMTRHYNVRGLDASYLPADFSTLTELDALPPLPTRPKGEDITTPPMGVFSLDIDADGLPGLSWPVIVGALNGVRATVQRDLTEYGPSVVRANSAEFDVVGAFDVQEEIHQIVAAGNADLLTTLAVPDDMRPSIVTFRFLGRALVEPDVAAVVQAPLTSDQDMDLATCAATRAALVHRDSNEIGGQ